LEDLQHTSDPITEQAFLELWRTCFPEVVLRRKFNVIGKCAACEFISERRKTHGGSAYMSAKLTEAHNIHRAGQDEVKADETIAITVDSFSTESTARGS